MRQFSMSQYSNIEDLYKAKAEYFEREFEEVLSALEGMALQYLTRHDNDLLDHHFMSAGENCLDVLEKLRIVKDVGRELYQWVDGHEFAEKQLEQQEEKD